MQAENWESETMTAEEAQEFIDMYRKGESTGGVASIGVPRTTYSGYRPGELEAQSSRIEDAQSLIDLARYSGTVF